jgi:hypothetical protein
LLDESNTAAVDDVEDILPSLNRGQDQVCSLLARHYQSPLLTHTEYTLTSGVSEYPIPEEALEQRVTKVEVNVGGLYVPVKEISHTDISLYEHPAPAAVPLYWCGVGLDFRLVPTPAATYPLRIWYPLEPAPLVLPQGRITRLDANGAYLVVDGVGEDITPEADQLNSYVNLVDGRTGRIKATLQVASITGNRISFRAGPARTSVLDRQVSATYSTTGSLAVALDDYVCTVAGTCIPVLRKPSANYLIEWAVAELRGTKLGGEVGGERQVLAKLEEAVERSWAGRANNLRVHKVSPFWGRPSRRLITSGS